MGVVIETDPQNESGSMAPGVPPSIFWGSRFEIPEKLMLPEQCSGFLPSRIRCPIPVGWGVESLR